MRTAHASWFIECSVGCVSLEQCISIRTSSDCRNILGFENCRCKLCKLLLRDAFEVPSILGRALVGMVFCALRGRLQQVVEAILEQPNVPFWTVCKLCTVFNPRPIHVEFADCSFYINFRHLSQRNTEPLLLGRC